MTCKDCVHNDVCNYWVKKQYGENRYLEAREGFICEDFKDKSKFVELPCKVGDIVYLIPALVNMIGFNIKGIEIFKCKVKSITIQSNNSIRVNLCQGDKTISYYIQSFDFGKTVFLTYEEAEAALKEREQNGKSN